MGSYMKHEGLILVGIYNSVSSS